MFSHWLSRTRWVKTQQKEVSILEITLGEKILFFEKYEIQDESSLSASKTSTRFDLN